MLAAFDRKGPTFRHEEFKEYKAQRKPAPDDLIPQFSMVGEVLDAFNIPVVKKKGFEADDIIGTLVTKVGEGASKIVVTGDMDALQLVNETTSVFVLRRGVSDTVTYDSAAVLGRFGFGPELVADYKGLRGDPSDNIPGLPGVGEKTAKDLVTRFGAIENIYKHLDELPDKVQRRLQGKKQEALFSRKLATIKRDVEVDFDLRDAVVTDYDVAQVRALFERLELKSFMQRLPRSARAEAQPTLFTRGGKTEGKNEYILPDNYHLVEGKEAEKLREQLGKEK